MDLERGVVRDQRMIECLKNDYRAEAEEEGKVENKE